MTINPRSPGSGTAAFAPAWGVDGVRGTALLDDQAVFHEQNAVGRLARELDLVRCVCASPPRTLKAATSDVIVRVTGD
jgi:hypothetical protein